tara:strand:+ start:826 stop:1470 length:645 start_codon:yes stop_codon:yes gene_type:complete
MYPVVVQDNFFPDPDAIVEYSQQLEYLTDPNGRWPGKRSKYFHELDHELFAFVGTKIHNIFYENPPQFWEMEMSFQITSPLHEDPTNKKNLGWVHKDTNRFFGGVIYLNKNPEKNTGTSIYKLKKGYSDDVPQLLRTKELFYNGVSLSDEEYNQSFDKYHDQYQETVTVENVYNRLLLFGGDIYHAAKSFGTSDRLTISFFSKSLVGCYPPLIR